jgi:acetyl-CoA synthetase
MNALQQFTEARDLLIALRTDYARATTQFSWPRLGEFNWALDYFDSMARANDATALWVLDESGAEERISFAQMSERSSRVANYLRERGVRRGDNILLMLGNQVPLWETMLAAIKLGAVVIPASTLLTETDLEDRVARGRVRHVVAAREFCGKFDGLLGGFTRICVSAACDGWHNYADAYRCSADFTADGVTRASDSLLLYFTSGTTAKPKLVLHTHQSYPIGHLSTMYWLGLRPGDVHWNISSPGWAKHAWSCFFAPWNAGAAVFVYNYARFAASDILATLARAPITSLCAPPTVWRMLIQEPLETTRHSLREVAGAGEPLNPEVIARVERAWGLVLRDGYGQTETTALVGNSPGQPLKPGSMGRPLPGYRIALLDPDGHPSNEGEIALDLAAQPLGLMPGYEGDAQKTGEAMSDGFYRTGDVAARDDDGYITYVGRADDVFKASDYRVSPFELESILIEHPAVAEAAVVPSPDALRLAVPKAFVTLTAGHAPEAETARAILRYAKERLAPYKRIRRLEFSALPKTISGKIRRVELRVREAGRAPNSRFEAEFFEEDFSDAP